MDCGEDRGKEQKGPGIINHYTPSNRKGGKRLMGEYETGGNNHSGGLGVLVTSLNLI